MANKEYKFIIKPKCLKKDSAQVVEHRLLRVLKQMEADGLLTAPLIDVKVMNGYGYGTTDYEEIDHINIIFNVNEKK